MTQGPIIRAASPLVSSRYQARLTKGVILPLLLPSIFAFSQANAQHSSQAIGAFQPFSVGTVQSDYQIAQPTIITSIPGANSVVALSAAETAIGLMPAGQFLPQAPTTGTRSSDAQPPQVDAFSPSQFSSTAPTTVVNEGEGAGWTSEPIPAASEFLDPPGVNSPFVAQGDDPDQASGLRAQVNAALEPLEGFASDVAGTVKQSADRSRRAFGEQAQKGVKGHIGAGIWMDPVFAGSNVYEFSPAAIGDLTFAELLRWRHDEGVEFIPFAQLPFDLAIGLDWRSGRQGRHVPNGISDVEGGIELGFELAIPIGDTEIFADAERGLMGDNLGWSLETGVRTTGIRVNRRGEVNASISTTWLDASAMGTEYAVSPAEAGLSGLEVYAVDSGLRDVTADLELMFFMNERLGVYAGVRGQVLIEQAAKSPIVTEEGSPLQLSSRLGMLYRF